MQPDNLSILDMLTFIYEDLDIDAIEEKFIDLTYKVFSFDKVGLFFVKHKKGVLQGKLCRGFESGTISSLEIPVDERSLLTKPLISGYPLWGEQLGNDPWAAKIGLTNFAIIPLINQKRVPCWQVKDCWLTHH